MKNNNSIEQVLENLDKSIISKKKNSVFSGILLFIVGISCLISYSTFEWGMYAVLAQVVFILGFICAIIGIFKTFVRKSYYVSTENRMKIQSFEIYFNLKEQHKLVQSVESDDLSGLKLLAPSVVNGLKIRVMATKDGSMCFSQAVAYNANEYVAITPVKKNSLLDYQILTGINQSRN